MAGTVDLYLSDRKPLRPTSNYVWTGSLWVPMLGAADGSVAVGGKPEDGASADGDQGTPILVVRRAVPVNSSGSDGDYEFLQISAGRLWTSGLVTDLVPGVAATNLGKAEDAAHASGDTGVMALGVYKATPTQLAGSDGDYSVPITGAYGQIWAGLVNPSDGSTVAIAPGPSLTSRILSAAASTNGTSAKASAGYIYNIQGYNAAASVRYLKIYNKASAPTVGSDTPIKSIPLPPTAFFTMDWAVGYSCTIGIAYALTTGSADADTGALTAGDILGLNVDYS